MSNLSMITDDGYTYFIYGDEPDSEPVDKSFFPLEELSRQLDRNCENRNNHSMIKTHEVLAVLLHEMVGREKATEIMWEIAEWGGLDSMSGLHNSDGFGLAYPEYFQEGLSNDDWKLED